MEKEVAVNIQVQFLPGIKSVRKVVQWKRQLAAKVLEIVTVLYENRYH
jgi:hypothetical protein